MSNCHTLLRTSISRASKMYGILSTSNAKFFQGLMRKANRELNCYAFIPLAIFCIISTLTIIPIKIKLFTVSLPYNNTKKSKSTIFRMRKNITDFSICFANRPIILNKISLINKNYTLTNNGDKSSHKIVSHTGKQWINKNKNDWIKIYTNLSMFI